MQHLPVRQPVALVYGPRCRPGPRTQALGQRGGVVLVVGAYEQVPPALVDGYPLGAQALGERARVMVVGERDPNLPLRDASVLGFRESPPAPGAHARQRARTRFAGSDSAAVLPALLDGMPAENAELAGETPSRSIAPWTTTRTRSASCSEST